MSKNPITTKTFASTARCYMAVNVILTFNDENECGDSQEFFDLKLPLRASHKSAEKFIDEHLFKRIAAKCRTYGRDPRQLIKISTASDWDMFEAKTGKPSLPSLGHSCKWYFGAGRLDLDPWEQQLAEAYGFGSDVDMSWLNEPDPNVRGALFLDQVLQRQSLRSSQSTK